MLVSGLEPHRGPLGMGAMIVIHTCLCPVLEKAEALPEGQGAETRANGWEENIQECL